jgi:hypothetical protein
LPLKPLFWREWRYLHHPVPVAPSIARLCRIFVVDTPRLCKVN